MNGGDHHSQILVAHPMGEVGVAHDVNETGEAVLVLAGKEAVDPCKHKLCHARQ
jgi:hypothetical protein